MSVGGSASLTFTIRNPGTVSLTGIAVSKDGANSTDFTVAPSPATSVVSGGSTTFGIAFSPTAGGLRTAILHIASNDADENPRAGLFSLLRDGAIVIAGEYISHREIFTVTPIAAANGTISPNFPQPVSYGDSVTFAATPNPDYKVDQWLVDDTPVRTGGISFSLGDVTQDASVKVTFVPKFVTVTPSAGPNGSINPGAPKTIDGGGDLALTATPISGYSVNQWLVNGSVAQTGGNGFPLSHVTANVTVQVTFKPVQSSFTYTGQIPSQNTTIISAQTGSSVAASVSGTITISYNATAQSYTISASWSLISPAYPGREASSSAVTSADGVPPAIIGLSISETGGGSSGADLSLSRGTNGYTGTVTLHTKWKTSYTGNADRTGVADTTHSPVNVQ